MTSNGALLSLTGVTKRFGAVQALGGVDFEVHAGEVVGLVGDNGAGKSTLVKTIAGIYSPDDGEFKFDGQPVSISSPHAATDLGIATVYQDLALCDNLDVVANLFLGREEIAGGPGRSRASSTRPRWSTARTSCSRTWRSRSPAFAPRWARCPAASASRWRWRGRCSGKPKMVMLDEPTAALGVPQTGEVLALIKRLKEQGLAVVVISHNLADVFEVCDRVFVLRLGARPATSRSARRRTRRSWAPSPAPAARTASERGRAHDAAPHTPLT